MDPAAFQAHAGSERPSSIAGLYKQIDSLTSQTSVNYPTDYIGTLKDISKNHWKPIDNRTCCFNLNCKKQFSTLLERPKHCRSCGEVFCDNCVKFKRRLSKLAQPDPDGDFYKVCKDCFEQGKWTDGQTRNYTLHFLDLRQHAKQNAQVLSRLNFNLTRECERLIQGFKQSIGTSELNFKLHEMKSLISTPEWMKSNLWIRENIASSCKFCKEKFGFFTKKDFCRLCSVSVCHSCSSKDLLLYISDDYRAKEDYSFEPQLTIIKIIGCPNKEPEISLYLRICPSCNDKMTQRQIEAFEEEDNLFVGSDFMENLNKIDQKMKKGEEQVKSQLPKYRTIVESLEDRSRKSEYQNNMKILAKAQTDLNDVLAQYVTTVQQLKKLNPITNTQSSVLKKYILAKCEFYLDSMSTFRLLKHKLSEVVSPESLQFIQLTIEKDAIISTQVYLRQLIYETLDLCQKYKLEEKIPSLLIKIEESVEADLVACLTAAHEDIHKHMEVLKEFLQERIKANKLIRVSKTQFSRKGTPYVRDLMNSQVENVLSKVLNQLQLVSVLRSLSATKKALETGLADLQNSSVGEDETDFVLV